MRGWWDEENVLTSTTSVHTIKRKAKTLRSYRLSDGTVAKMEALRGWHKSKSLTAVIEQLVESAWKNIPPHALPVPEDDVDDSKE